MTRILGTLLGVSFQTELLIMALLGLANSTLDWKPFELGLRLNLIRDMHFPIDNAQLNNNFTSWIKKVLRVTVVVEFVCSLLNPFASVMKLYPVLTWTREDILLPWLVIHALNVLIPKMLSIGLAFIFYSENIISTMALAEFLIVESINLMVAGYNWYVFFVFYLDLHDVNKKAALSKRLFQGSFDSVPEISSSTSSMESMLKASSSYCKSTLPIRLGRSISTMEMNSEEVELEDTSLSAESCQLTPAEKTMRLLSLTEHDLEEARRQKLPGTSNFAAAVKLDASSSDPEAESSSACSCSSSEDEAPSLAAKGAHEERRRDDHDDEGARDCCLSGAGGKLRAAKKPRQTLKAHEFTQTRSRDEEDAYFFLKRRFRALDKMCQALNFDDQQSLHSNTHKWLVFRHELDTHLRRHVFFKEPFATAQSAGSDCATVIRDESSQTEPPRRHSAKRQRSRDRKSRKRLSAVADDEVFKRKWNYLGSAVGSSSEVFHHRRASGSACPADESCEATSSYRQIGKLKCRRFKPQARLPIASDHGAGRGGRELRNLQVYNQWTLEQDRRELFAKRKKSRMTSNKPIGEFASCGLPARRRPPRIKSDDRALEATTAGAALAQDESSNGHSPSGSMREIIERLDWSVRSSPPIPPRTRVPRKNAHRGRQLGLGSWSAAPQQRGIVDDETVSTLRSAFSYSDDADRGFRIGPEAREPYPIFQVVAVTVAEILKATDWRNLAGGGGSSIWTENEIELLGLDDDDAVFVCGGNDAGDTGRFAELPISAEQKKWAESPGAAEESDEEAETRRRNVSVALLEELEELLDSSREALSDVEIWRILAADSKKVLEKSAAGGSSRVPAAPRQSSNYLVDLFNRFYRKFVRRIESDDGDVAADFHEDLEQLTRTENFVNFMSLVGEELPDDYR